jgi:hypothetical protein
MFELSPLSEEDRKFDLGAARSVDDLTQSAMLATSENATSVKRDRCVMLV